MRLRSSRAASASDCQGLIPVDIASPLILLSSGAGDHFQEWEMLYQLENRTSALLYAHGNNQLLQMHGGGNEEYVGSIQKDV